MNEELLQRIERLERRNALLTRVGAVALVGLVALATLLAPQGIASLIGLPVNQTIQARDFQLLGEDGRLRARLTTVSDGPALTFFRDGKLAADLHMFGDDSGLTFYENERTCATLFSSLKGRGLFFYDRTSQARSGLGLFSAGPSLELYSEGGQLRAVFGVAKFGEHGPGGGPPTSESSLVLFDKDGKIIHQAGE